MPARNKCGFSLPDRRLGGRKVNPHPVVNPYCQRNRPDIHDSEGDIFRDQVICSIYGKAMARMKPKFRRGKSIGKNMGEAEHCWKCTAYGCSYSHDLSAALDHEDPLPSSARDQAQ